MKALKELLKKDLQKKAQPLYQKTIDIFFLKKDGIMAYSGKQISILRALLDDFRFCLGKSKRWLKLKLTDRQRRELKTILPIFASISLYCTSIELFARIFHKKQPNNIEKETSENYFKESATMWFGLSDEQAAILWKLRNNIFHHYKLKIGYNIAIKGTGPVYKLRNDFWIFSVEEMHKSLLKAQRKIYSFLSHEQDKKATSDYINNNCFIYIIPDKSKK